MHASLERQFVNAFTDILLQAKTDALIPIVKLFIGQIEKYGFSLEEILLVLSVELGERDLDRASSLL